MTNKNKGKTKVDEVEDTIEVEETAKDEPETDKAAKDEPPAGEALEKDPPAADAGKEPEKAATETKVKAVRPKPQPVKETDSDASVAKELMVKRGIKKVYKVGNVWFTDEQYAQQSSKKQGLTIKTFE